MVTSIVDMLPTAGASAPKSAAAGQKAASGDVSFSEVLTAACAECQNGSENTETDLPEDSLDETSAETAGDTDAAEMEDQAAVEILFCLAMVVPPTETATETEETSGVTEVMAVETQSTPASAPVVAAEPVVAEAAPETAPETQEASNPAQNVAVDVQATAPAETAEAIPEPQGEDVAKSAAEAVQAAVSAQAGNPEVQPETEVTVTPPAVPQPPANAAAKSLANVEPQKDAAEQATVVVAETEPVEPETTAADPETESVTPMTSETESSETTPSKPKEEAAPNNAGSPVTRAASPRAENNARIAERAIRPAKEQETAQAQLAADSPVSQTAGKSGGKVIAASVNVPVASEQQSPEPTGAATAVKRVAQRVASTPAAKTSVQSTMVAPTGDTGNAHVNLVTVVAPENVTTPDTTVPADSVTVPVVKNVRYLVSKGQQSVTVRLVPASLGELHVEVQNNGGELAVRLVSANPAVRDTLQSQAPLLKEALSKEGLHVNNLEIAASMGQTANSGSQPGYTAQQDLAARPVWNVGRGYQGQTSSAADPVVRRTAVHQGALDVFA